MKVLIGYDGSKSAKDAISGLRRAGLPHDVDAHIVSVADVWPALPRSIYESNQPDANDSPLVRKAAELARLARAEAQSFAAEGAALVSEAFPDWKVSHAVELGPPYLALVEPTKGVPDLVAVGHQGRSALGGLILGSVAQKVIQYATCTVRVSRPSQASGAGNLGDRPIRIVLGIDGSSHSALAVNTVASRAWPTKTEVKVVAVMDAKLWAALANPHSAQIEWTAGDQEMKDGRSWAHRAVESVAETLRAANLVASTQVVEGDPKHVLVDEAARWQADCIFVGAKGQSGLERFLLGSVSAAVATRAPCSVEIVRSE